MEETTPNTSRDTNSVNFPLLAIEKTNALPEVLFHRRQHRRAFNALRQISHNRSASTKKKKKKFRNNVTILYYVHSIALWSTGVVPRGRRGSLHNENEKRTSWYPINACWSPWITVWSRRMIQRRTHNDGLIAPVNCYYSSRVRYVLATLRPCSFLIATT